ncbi:GNAT family N-acetyltransferase [Solihabitans fulvus]|uniref:GNAT family N-acetyltransferase n=1 Tax=Solihabitans fulvus TaxID=1892852 RepID=A0A5B2XPS8_9PSEU|nr:GNAT family N-acetyltransferase [Solihabitans fulvus]KAA2265747.1 GNAT family N-acetyltransferase [Solihabitans fulvus]
MRTYLTTDRMILRHITDDDLDLLHALDNDPGVMRYLNGGQPTPRDTIRDRILPTIRAHDERGLGFGYFAAQHKTTNDFLGWFEFSPPDGHDLDNVELGYRLHTATWGNGYATEGSRALLTKGFTELGVRRVTANTMFVNTGSRRVMEKAGLSHVRTYHQDWPTPLPGSEHGEVEYVITRDQWAANQHPTA